MAAGEKVESEQGISLTNNNSNLDKMTPGVITRVVNGSTDSMMEEVAEQVVEEGGEQHIVLEQGQQVVMVQGEMGQQQIVITDGSGSLIQIQGGQEGEQFVMKTEPEDLSLVPGEVREERSIDMEAGAQAIQASAAAAVQNVIRSLKEPDKNSVLTSLLPGPGQVARTSDQSNIVFVEGGDTSDTEMSSPNGATPTKRARSSTTDLPRVQIAKQYTPYGFHCVLEAPTAQWVRKEEDRCTYLNKGQFYGLTLEYRHNQSEPFPGDVKQVKSVVMLVFRDAKNPEEETNAWDFWHQRQPTSKQRIIDAETNNMTDQCGISQIEDVAYNAIAVYWSPLQKPALISCAIQCLSTDFSLQKGVKGLALHLQVDTYCRGPGDSDYEHLVHRAYCQVKVFCDKGAERKFRQEERRAARKVAVGGQRVLDMYHQVGSDREETADLFFTTDGLYFSAKKGLIFTLWLTLVKCLCCTPLDQVTNRNPPSLVRHYLLFTVTISLVCSTTGLQQPAIAGGSPAGVSSGGSGSVSILKSNNSSSSVTGAEVRGRKVRLVSDV